VKKIVYLFFLLCPVISFAQQTKYTDYWVQLTDKNNNTYSLSNPLQYLSQRAIDRRQKYGIPIDEKDLPVNPQYVDSILNTGVTILNVSKWLNSVTVTTRDSDAMKKIDAFSFVKKSQPARAPISSGNNKFSNENIHQHPLLQKPAQLDANYYGLAYDQIHQLNGDYLHNKGFKGQGMIIASLDDGFFNANSMRVFDSLFSSGRVLFTRNFVFPSKNVFQGTPNVINGEHGSWTLSTMASNLPDNMVGTCPEASFVLLHTEEDTAENFVETLNWAAGAEVADSIGADVITSSLGYTVLTSDSALGFRYSQMNGHTSPASIAATDAADKGILVCVAAGNDGGDTWNFIGSPADADSIISVGAVDLTGILAEFSSRGPSADGRIKPDLDACGLGATIADPSGYIIGGNGTSFSCPILAGLVTCFLQAHPKLTPQQIIHLLKETASNSSSPNNNYGCGIPNFEAADSVAKLTGIEPVHSQKNILSVFPNPVQNGILHINVNSENDSPAEIIITDENGKVVSLENYFLFKGTDHIVIDNLKNLPATVYTIQLRMPQRTASGLFVKTN
jgi:serine protease AprX